MRYFIATYAQMPNGKYNEMVKFDHKVRDKDLISASVILDYKDKKIVKCRFESEFGDLEKTFETIDNFYKGHYGEAIAAVEAKFQAIEEVAKEIADEIKVEISKQEEKQDE